jgi:hypothetical protein
MKRTRNEWVTGPVLAVAIAGTGIEFAAVRGVAAAGPAAAAASQPTTAPAGQARQRNVAGEIVLTFASAPEGRPLPSWTEGDVTFTLASSPQNSRAQGRVMFFPHLKTDRRGILNAMANEQAIPVRAEITGAAASVTLVLWGTIGSRAWLEARDKDGKLLDRASLPGTVPERKSPSEPIPSFELTVKGDRVAFVLFGGAPNGGALVADEVRYVPVDQPAAAPNNR